MYIYLPGYNSKTLVGINHALAKLFATFGRAPLKNAVDSVNVLTAANHALDILCILHDVVHQILCIESHECHLIIRIMSTNVCFQSWHVSLAILHSVDSP